MKLKKIMAAMVACLVTWVSLGTVPCDYKDRCGITAISLYTDRNCDS